MVHPALTRRFFSRPTLRVARELLGMHLVRRIGRKTLRGIITETEAYVGETDLACHAARGRTKRSEALWREAGTLYVYFIYGMYWCVNVVTERKEYPAAVLVRAMEPIENAARMMKNRHREPQKGLRGLTDGPGKLCQALRITGALNGKPLVQRTGLWIEDGGKRIPRSKILSTPRIGVHYAKQCAAYPWRFVLKT